MKKLAALALLALPLAPALAVDHQDSVIEGEGGQLFLRQEVILDAPVASVWALFTTSEGAASWMAPVADVDLRPGGSVRTHYDANASLGDPGTIETRIVNYIPEHMLTLQADLAPVQADWLTDAIRAEAGNLYNVIEFEALGDGRTRVVSWGIGYRNDPEWKTMLDFFERANRWTLGELEKSVGRQDKVEQVVIPAATMSGDLAPLRFLIGKCWRGSFGDGPAYDVLCAEEMPGGHVRTRHVVRGVDTDYRGETLYHFDGEAQQIGFTYYASSGGVTKGITTLEEDGSLTFADSRYVYPDGSYHRVRGRISETEDGGFRTESALMRGDGWEEQPALVMYPIDCTDWSAVETGCD